MAAILETIPEVSAIGVFHIAHECLPAVEARSENALNVPGLAATLLRERDLARVAALLDDGPVQLVTRHPQSSSVLVSCARGCHLFVAVVPQMADVGKALYHLKRAAGVPPESMGVEPLPLEGSCELELH